MNKFYVKRFYALFLALMVTMLFSLSLTAYALDPVSYLDGTGTEQTCADYTVVDDDQQ